MTSPSEPSPGTPADLPTPPDEAPKKRHRIGLTIGIAAGVVLLMLITAGVTSVIVGGDDKTAVADASPTPLDTSPPPDYSTVAEEPPLPVIITMTYEVTGTGTADITYTADQYGGTAQASNQSLPWTHDVTLDQSLNGGNYSGLYVPAQRRSGNGGSIVCRITSADAAEYFGLPRDRTLTVGSRIQV